nr:hypothetical protein [Methylobacterium sp. ZNC0032]
MAYRPFYDLVSEDTPATFAIPATFQPQTVQSVAELANVAGVPAETAYAQGPPEDDKVSGQLAQKPEGLSAEERQYLYEERAAILEYDAGLSREEAERVAGAQTNAIVH